MLSNDPAFTEDIDGTMTAATVCTLYQACARNEAHTLHDILNRGVTRQEVMELDINGRNGLMVAVYKGFADIVSGLHSCPYLDINHQDKEGNTALMIAAQAGHISILNYILNYFAGTDMEMRDSRGFTALMKAAMQGRSRCVTALVMAGANMHAVDVSQGKCAREWALKTGRWETLQTLRHLSSRPRAEQFCESYIPEWTDLQDLVARAMVTKSWGERFLQRLRSILSFSFLQAPQDNGVLDHMVRITTSVRSLFVVTACHPLRPTSPPEVGKKRPAVSELVRHCSARQLEELSVQNSKGSASSVSPSSISAVSDVLMLDSCCADTEHKRNRLAPVSQGVRGLIPRHSSVFPAGCVPQIRVTRSREPMPKKEKIRRKASSHLEPPMWKYKEKKKDKIKDNVEVS